MSVTNDRSLLGPSSNLTDVQRAPRFVAWLFVMSAEGIQAKGKGENQSELTVVRMKIRAPRFVACFVVWCLMIEWSKIDGSNSTGGLMTAPRFVA